MYEASEQEKNQDREPYGRTQSPTATKPYIHLTIPGGSAANTVAPGEPVRISVRNLPRGTTIEILVDGVVALKVSVNQRGELVASVYAPRDFGLHRITIRDAATAAVIDGTMFIVKHRDDRDQRKRPNQPRTTVSR